MNQQLRVHLNDPALPKRLQALADAAPGSALLSLSLELGDAPSDWLDHLPATAPYWYRSQPALGKFALGIGHALHLSSSGAQRFAALDKAYAGLRLDWRYNGQPKVFCGFSFGEQSSHPELPAALLAVPAILLESGDGRAQLTLTTTVAQLDDAIAGWTALLSHPAAAAPPGPWQPMPDSTLAERAWVARVTAAQRDIQHGQLSKVVLARSRHLLSGTPISARHLLATLSAEQPDACIYAFSQNATTFLGASPERLLALAGRHIESDALAGTAWPGSELLEGSKNRHEQSLVVAAIIEALAPFCTGQPLAAPVEIQAAGKLTHLRSRISGTALPATTFFELINAVHPTPAVGGYPSAAAIAWLHSHNEQRNGWYSGGFAMLDAAGNGSVAVALRSALIQGRQIELQAGAGIVADSAAWQELAETNAKLGTLLDALDTTLTARQQKDA